MLSDEQKSSIDSLLDDVEQSSISSIQRVISEIIRVMNDPLSTAKELKEIIEVDPPLTMRVLKRANSVYYARQRTISDIQEAIIWIGFSALKELALNQKIYELFGQAETIHGFSRIELWKQSVSVAITAKLIYRREFGQPGDNAYAAGLLHNIGIIIIDQFLREEFEAILIRHENGNTNLYQDERSILGFDHAQLGMTLVNRWGLPDELSTSIGHHHLPHTLDHEASILAYTLYLANAICDDLQLGYVDAPHKNDNLYDQVLEDLQIDTKGIDYIKGEVAKIVSKMTQQGWFQHA